jgi:RimJ/RimL family protein N-acetyltransferase
MHNRVSNEDTMRNLDEYVIETPRLRLVPFAQAHAPALNAINNEPSVMEFLSNGTPETLQETIAAITRVLVRWQRLGYGWWAVFDRLTNDIIGAACVQNTANTDNAPLEIGWRLTNNSRGKGFATEAGQAAIDFAFGNLGADHVVSVADPRNIASHKVMIRLGMTYRGIETHYDVPCTTYVLKNPNQ